MSTKIYTYKPRNLEVMKT